MANIALSKDQNDFLVIFKAQYGRTPSLKEYRDWEGMVKRAKGQIKAQKTRRLKKAQVAVQDWQSATEEQKVEMISTAVKYLLNRKKSDPYQDKIVSIIKEDKVADRLLSYLTGYNSYTANAKSPYHENGFVRRGWQKAKKGEEISILEMIAYMLSPNTVTL